MRAALDEFSEYLDEGFDAGEWNNIMVDRPREVIARVHAERAVRWKELGSGDIADTIIAELAAKGYVIVPREPTEEMVNAADPHGIIMADFKAGWQAMIDVALSNGERS